MSKANFIHSVLNAKKRAERGFKYTGQQIRQNLDEGQKNLRGPKSDYYGTINPLKGTLTAFKRGYAE